MNFQTTYNNLKKNIGDNYKKLYDIIVLIFY